MPEDRGPDPALPARGQEPATACEEATEEAGSAAAIVPALEALLFAAEGPLSREALEAALPPGDRGALEEGLELLRAQYRGGGRGMQIVEVAGGYRMTTRPEFDAHLRAMFRHRHRVRLGRAALETLAIIAYRQPITAPEIAEIRGKDPAAVLGSLQERGLVRAVGRKKVVGKPFLYGTTAEFLAHFGLNSLEDLPTLEEFSALLGPAALDEETEREPVPDGPPLPAVERGEE